MKALPDAEGMVALTLGSLVVFEGVKLARDWSPPLNAVRRSDDSGTTDDCRLGYMAAASVTLSLGMAVTILSQSKAPLLLSLLSVAIMTAIHEYAIYVKTSAPLSVLGG